MPMTRRELALQIIRETEGQAPQQAVQPSVQPPIVAPTDTVQPMAPMPSAGNIEPQAQPQQQPMTRRQLAEQIVRETEVEQPAAQPTTEKGILQNAIDTIKTYAPFTPPGMLLHEADIRMKVADGLYDMIAGASKTTPEIEAAQPYQMSPDVGSIADIAPLGGIGMLGQLVGSGRGVGAMMDTAKDLYRAAVSPDKEIKFKSWTEYPPLKRMEDALRGPIISISTLMTGNDETKQIIEKWLPEATWKQDKKGNWLFKTPKDKEWYGIQPGLNAQDAIRAMTTMAAAVGTQGKSLQAQLGSAAAFGVGTQAMEAAAGGEFNPLDAALEVAFEGAPTILKGASDYGLNAVKKIFGMADQLPVPGGVAGDIGTAVGVDQKWLEQSLKDANPAAHKLFKSIKDKGYTEGWDEAAEAALDRAGIDPNDVAELVELTDPKKLTEIGDRTVGLVKSITGKDPKLVRTGGFAEKIKSQNKGVDLSITDNVDEIVVDKISVPEEARGTGLATKAMQDIVDLADREGKTVSLFPSEDFGADVGRLKGFYERFGFTERPGTSAMYRTPQQPTPTGAAAKGMSPDESKQLVKTIKKAGRGSKEARKDLVEKFNITEETLSDFETAGLGDLPPDVMTEDYGMAVVGALPRAKVGTDAQSQWRGIVQSANDTVEDQFEKMGAVYFDGKPSVPMVSAEVKKSLTDAKNGIMKQASDLRNDVNKVVDMKQQAVTDNTTELLVDLMESNPNSMTNIEKKLLKGLDSGNFKYGDLERERRIIGQALEGKQTKYNSGGETVDAESLRELYAALALDREATVEAFGQANGVTGLGDKLAASNKLFSEAFDLNKKIVSSFGETDAGGIGNALVRSIKSAASPGGDVAELAKIMEIVPDDLKSKVMITTVPAIARSKSAKSAIKGGFGFSEYKDLYDGLRKNPEAMKLIMGKMKPEAKKFLSSLYLPSKNITRTRALVEDRALQQTALFSEMQMGNLVQRLMKGPTSRAVITEVAGKVPGGAFLTSRYADSLADVGTRGLDKINDVLTSKELNNAIKRTVKEGSDSEQIREQAIKSIANSKAFKDYAKTFKIAEPEAWIRTALRPITRQEQETLENE